MFMVSIVCNSHAVTTTVVLSSTRYLTQKPYVNLYYNGFMLSIHLLYGSCAILGYRTSTFDSFSLVHLNLLQILDKIKNNEMKFMRRNL